MGTIKDKHPSLQLLAAEVQKQFGDQVAILATSADSSSLSFSGKVKAGHAPSASVVTANQKVGKYSVQIEVPTPEREHPIDIAFIGENVDLQALIGLIRKHLVEQVQK